MAADEKMLVNALYHSAAVSSSANGYSRLGKMLAGGALHKLDLMPHDAGILIASVALTMSPKDTIIKQRIIPAPLIS